MSVRGSIFSPDNGFSTAIFGKKSKSLCEFYSCACFIFGVEKNEDRVMYGHFFIVK